MKNGVSSFTYVAWWFISEVEKYDIFAACNLDIVVPMTCYVVKRGDANIFVTGRLLKKIYLCYWEREMFALIKDAAGLMFVS